MWDGLIHKNDVNLTMKYTKNTKYKNTRRTHPYTQTCRKSRIYKFKFTQNEIRAMRGTTYTYTQ